MAQKKSARSDFMRPGNGLVDGLREDAEARREAGLKQHASAALELLVDYGLPERSQCVALKVIELFVSVTPERGEGRTAAAMAVAKGEALGDEGFKKLRGRERTVTRNEIINGLGAARQALQEAFDQSNKVLVPA